MLAGEPAVFCRPVVTVPAVIRRDGTVLADAWLPDLVRLGELEAHLGEGVTEAAAVASVRLKPMQRRRIMPYPLVIRLMLAMGLIVRRVVLRGASPAGGAARRHPVRPGEAYRTGGAPPRPRSGRTSPPSPAPGTASAAPSCALAPRDWSSRKPGTG